MAGEVFETSGNDSFAKATLLGRAEDNSFVNGSFTLSNDTFDVYKFTVDRPTKFAATLFPTGVDANLALFNSQGQNIKSSSNRGTAAVEEINADNLPVGDYFLSVNKVLGSGIYQLGTSGAAIARAQLSVTVDRVTALQSFDTRIPGTTFGEADFIIEALQSDPGGANLVRKSSRSGNRDNVSPNDFTLTRSVNINQRSLFAAINVADNDPDPDLDDIADLSPSPSLAGIFMDFDTVRGEVIPRNPIIGRTDGSFNGNRREGDVITTEGDGRDSFFDVKKARIQFRVNYDTFTSSSFFIPNSTPVIRGNGGSQALTGQDNSGILCGEGGNDDLSGMGGNDILCGGTGNDKLNGGTGKDISFGGAGRDTHLGGAGSDTFVLTPNSGVDVIRDFQNGVDQIGLVMGIGFEMLEIVQQGKNTVIGAGSQRLAVLSNVKADQITAADFVTVDFTHFQGVEVPTIVI
jgi:serralysin